MRLLRASMSLLLLSLIATIGASAATELHRYPAFGLVLAVDGSKSFTVSCKEIPGFMDAMEMHLDAANAKLLNGVKPGEMVDFTLVVGNDVPYADEIREHKFRSAEQRQVEAHYLTIVAGAFDAKPNAPGMLAIGEKVPDFTLIDQHGLPVKLSDMAGKVVALSFMYTRCSYAQYCMRLSNNLGMVGRRFPDRTGKDLALMTISFDPKNDTPEVLEKYSETWKSAASGWYFLTGPADDVKRACLMFGMNFWPDMGMLVHVMHTAVIDRNGVLVANLDGNEFTAQQLGDLLEAVMDRKP
ncbi:MAG: SCO family protein [Candidatus Acidiferrales bacterium]|jgi:protein SCO1/2